MLACFEVKSKNADEIEVDFKGIIKGFIASCRNSQVEIVSHFTSRGSGTYLRFYSEDEECIRMASALLSALLPENVVYRVVDCGKLHPFHGG